MSSLRSTRGRSALPAAVLVLAAFSAFASFSLLLPSVSAASSSSRPSAVYAAPTVVLDDSNFDALVGAAGARWVVEFYADWCGHCSRLAPLVQALAERVEESKAKAGDAIAADDWFNVRVGVINVDQSPGLAVRFKIAGIPRLFVIDGPDVRGFPPQHHADLAATLEAGTWKTEPIISGGILSPLGYPAMALSALARVGMGLVNTGAKLQEEHGVPTWLQALVFFGLCVGMSFAIGNIVRVILEYFFAPAASTAAATAASAAPTTPGKTPKAKKTN